MKYILLIVLILTNIGYFFNLSGLSSITYLIYSPVILSIYIFTSYQRNLLNFLNYKTNKNYIVHAYLILIGSTLLHLPFQWSIIGSKHLIFFTIPVLIYLVPYKEFISPRNVTIIYALSFLIGFGALAELDFSFEALLISQSSNFETCQHPFFFGIFFIYFIKNKNWKWSLITLILVILSFKRVVILALLLSVFAIFILPLLKNRKLFIPLAIILNSIYVYLSFLFGGGQFQEFFQDYFGFSIGELTMGRNSIYLYLNDIISSFNYSDFIVGKGQGYTYQYVLSAMDQIPHNDVVSLLIDHGLIVFCLFFYFLYKSVHLEYVIYFNVLMLTDNTMHYTAFLFLLFYFDKIPFSLNSLNNFKNPIMSKL